MARVALLPLQLQILATSVGTSDVKIALVACIFRAANRMSTLNSYGLFVLVIDKLPDALGL